MGVRQTDGQTDRRTDKDDDNTPSARKAKAQKPNSPCREHTNFIHEASAVFSVASNQTSNCWKFTLFTSRMITGLLYIVENMNNYTKIAIIPVITRNLAS